MRTSTIVVVSLFAISFELICVTCLPHRGSPFGIPFAATYAAWQNEAQVQNRHISLENTSSLRWHCMLQSENCIQIEMRDFR